MYNSVSVCASWTAVVSADSLGSRLSAKTGFSRIQDELQAIGCATWCYGMRVPRRKERVTAAVDCSFFNPTRKTSHKWVGFKDF